MNISLYQAAAAMNANGRWQEAIAENLSSSSIPGFKRQDISFAAIEAGLMPGSENATASAANAKHYGLPIDHSTVSFEAGQIKPTGVDTDLAIEGKGFFEIQMPNGEMAYTRDGEFQISSSGELVTKQGYAVMSDTGALQLDMHSKQPLTITSDGRLTQGPVKAKIKMVEFNDPSLLQHVGGGYFSANDAGLQMNDATESSVRQRFLEASNTTPATEMVQLMSAMRSYEANQKLIQIQDERIGSSIRDLSGAS